MNRETREMDNSLENILHKKNAPLGASAALPHLKL
jgi:hypothetical protein